MVRIIFVLIDIVLAIVTFNSGYGMVRSSDLEARDWGFLLIGAMFLFILRSALTFLKKPMARQLHSGLSFATAFGLWICVSPIIPKSVLLQMVLFYLFLPAVTILIIFLLRAPKVKQQFE